MTAAEHFGHVVCIVMFRFGYFELLRFATSVECVVKLLLAGV